MRCLANAVIAILAGSTALAEPATVQSGAHEGFSRLVISLPENPKWKVTKIGALVQLAIDDFKDGYDISNIYQYISNDRIQAVSSNGNRLTLELGCDCTIATFLEQSRFVVIDVASPGTILPKELLLTSEQEPPNFLTGIHDKKLVSEPPHESHSATKGQETGTSSTDTLKHLSEEGKTALNGGQMRLANAISSATSRGILDAPKFLAPTVPLARRPYLDTAPFTSHLPPEYHRLSKGLSMENVNFRSSLDLQPNEDPATIFRNESSVICPPDDTIDIGNWGEEGKFTSRVGYLRKSLFGELDQIDEIIKLDLAKTYIHYGFGAEAIQTLSLSNAVTKQESILAHIAYYLENGRPPKQNILNQYLDCRGAVSLWALISSSASFTADTDMKNNALEELSRLPPYLRELVGPLLSKKMRSMGDKDSAKLAIRNVLQRSMTPSSEILLEAMAASPDLYQNSAQPHNFSEISSWNDRTTPIALVALVDAKLSADETIDIQTAELVAAYRTESRMSEAWPELNRVHILSLLKLKDFDQAFNDLVVARAHMDANAFSSLRQAAVHDLVIFADDAVFLDLVFNNLDGIFNQLDDTSRQGVAERLLDLGFTSDAQRLARQVSRDAHSESRNLFTTRATVAIGEPTAAHTELHGLETGSADTLRALASLNSVGDDEANGMLQEPSSIEGVKHTARLTKNWESLSGLTEQSNHLIDKLKGGATPIDNEADGMLSNTNRALTESGRARNVISELLELTALP